MKAILKYTVLFFLALIVNARADNDPCLELLRSDLTSTTTSQAFKDFMGTDPEALNIYRTLSGSVSLRTNITVLNFYKKLTVNSLDALGTSLRTKLDDTKLLAFINDFKNVSVGDLQLLAANGGDLIDVWDGIKHLKNATKTVSFLQWLKKFKDTSPNTLYDHIFVGTTGKPGTNISGVHHKNALTTKTSGFVTGDIRIKAGTKVMKSDGYYEAQIEYFDGTNWLTKMEQKKVSGIKTYVPVANGFYPDAMTPDQIIEELALARSKVVLSDWVAPEPDQTTSNAFKGFLTNGQMVYICISNPQSSRPSTLGNYTYTIFPKF